MQKPKGIQREKTKTVSGPSQGFWWNAFPNLPIYLLNFSLAGHFYNQAFWQLCAPRKLNLLGKPMVGKSVTIRNSSRQNDFHFFCQRFRRTRLTHMSEMEQTFLSQPALMWTLREFKTNFISCRLNGVPVMLGMSATESAGISGKLPHAIK